MVSNPDVETKVERLFFAIRLSEAAALEANRAALQACAGFGLKSKLIPAERLHVTLHWLQDHETLSRELLDRAMAAGGRVGVAPFGVVFDRVESLGDVHHGGPLVLAGGAGLASLRKLQKALAAEMVDAGIGKYVRRSFKPHVTLLYDGKYVAPHAISPVVWTVDELVLVHSLVGRSKHVTLGRWQLQSRQMSLGDWCWP